MIHEVKSKSRERIGKEQKLIDIMFQIGLTIKNNPWFQGKSNEEVAEWISQQLNHCGFNVESCGASWGILVRKE